MAALLWQFSSHKMAKKQNFRNRYIELHAENLQTNFKSLAYMLSKRVQMNVHFVIFQYRNLKVFFA